MTQWKIIIHRDNQPDEEETDYDLYCISESIGLLILTEHIVSITVFRDGREHRVITVAEPAVVIEEARNAV